MKFFHGTGIFWATAVAVAMALGASPVLAASAVAADPRARYGLRGAGHWRRTARAGQPLYAHLVRAGLAGVHCLHRHLLADGGQAALTPRLCCSL